VRRDDGMGGVDGWAGLGLEMCGPAGRRRLFPARFEN
jgi:hypothetical protein